MRDRLRRLGPAIAGWALPFALVLYLGLKGGGYDAVVRSEVGIAVWWIVLLGAAGRGAARAPGSAAPAGSRSACSAAFARLDGARDRLVGERRAQRGRARAGRSPTSGCSRSRCASRAATACAGRSAAVGAAIAVVAALALLSRLHPAWFPAERDAPGSSPRAQARLNYPLNYWNGLAALIGDRASRCCSAIAARARPIAAPGARRRGAPGAGADRLLHALARRRDRDRASALVAFSPLPAAAAAAPDRCVTGAAAARS